MENTSTLFVYLSVLLKQKNKTKVNTKKVILVDSNVYFRDALKRTLEDIGGVEIIAQFSKGYDFLEYIKTTTSDLVFTEIRLEDISGIKLIRKSMEVNPNLKIIAFSYLEQQCIITRVIANGAKGYLSKTKNNLELLKTIIRENKKRIYMSNGILSEIRCETSNIGHQITSI